MIYVFINETIHIVSETFNDIGVIMELDKFIEKTLVDIAKGVSNAKDEVGKLGGKVNPEKSTVLATRKARQEGTIPNTYKTEHRVEFDIALQVKEESSVSGEGSLKLFSAVSLGVDGSSKDSLNTAHRVKFVVPIEMP